MNFTAALGEMGGRNGVRVMTLALDSDPGLSGLQYSPASLLAGRCGFCNTILEFLNILS